MSLTIHFIYKSTDRDDTLKIYKDTGLNCAYRVAFSPNSGTTYETYMSEGRLMDHISNIIYSLHNDLDPLAQVQVISPLQPSVLYDVQDLADSDISDSLIDSIETFLHSEIESS
jgi:hypothetical protein